MSKITRDQKKKKQSSEHNTRSQKIYQIYQGIPYDQGRMGENSQEQNKIKSSKRSERERERWQD